MQSIKNYQSPLGNITLAADEKGLTGLWFAEQKYYGSRLLGTEQEQETPILIETASWLDLYFAGDNPPMTISLHLTGTEFQYKVWEILKHIPYGRTMTYGEIADRLCEKYGCVSMSARAVGSAVGKNPISILIPCHRVIGVNGKLTGYAGGIERKQKLLKLEQQGVKSWR